MKRDKVFTITRADKGNTTVIMDTDDYDCKMNTIISDTITYKKLDIDPTDQYIKLIRKDLESLKNSLHITPQFYNQFYPRGCSAPKIYRLPKIHLTYMFKNFTLEENSILCSFNLVSMYSNCNVKK